MTAGRCKYCGDPIFKQNRCEKHYQNMLKLQEGSRQQALKKAAQTSQSRIAELCEHTGMDYEEAEHRDRFQQLKAQTMRCETVHDLRSVVYSLVEMMENRS